MKLSESLELLNDLGITDWISRDTGEFTRLAVNAIAEYFLEDPDPFNFRPYIESDFVYDYFLEHAWEIDWYSILSRDFVDTVELNINSIALSVNDSDPLMGVKETERYVELWVHEWRLKVRTKLSEEIAKNA